MFYNKVGYHDFEKLFIKDDQFVQAVFTDLKVEKELKKLSEEQSKKTN